jgi:uncharacterized membrane protein HdeD (DUF308 family)
MEKEQSHIKYYSVKLILYVALAVCVFIFRELLVQNLKYFIGGLMTLYGVEEILFEIVFRDKHFWHKDKIYLGIIELVFGVALLCLDLHDNAEETLIRTCLIWATWSIVRESFEIKELVTEIKSWTLTIISGIESIAVIVLSVMLILNPGEEDAMIHMYLLLLELLLTPLIPLLDEILLERKHKKELAEEKQGLN